jgi:hypothetical protein
VGHPSCHYWPEILAQTKQSVQVHCHGGKTNFQCTTSQADFAIHLPEDITEHLHSDVGSEFAPVE